MTEQGRRPNQVGWIVGFVLVANIFGALPIPPTIVVIWTMSLFANALFIGGLIGTWFLCTQNRQSWLFTPALVMAVYMLSSTFAFGSDWFLGPPTPAYEGFMAAVTYGWLGVVACTVYTYSFCKGRYPQPS